MKIRSSRTKYQISGDCSRRSNRLASNFWKMLRYEYFVTFLLKKFLYFRSYLVISSLPRGFKLEQSSGALSINVWIVTAPPIVKKLAPFSSSMNNSFKFLHFEMFNTFVFDRDENGDSQPVVGKNPVPPLIMTASLSRIYLMNFHFFDFIFQSAAFIFCKVLQQVWHFVLILIKFNSSIIALNDLQIDALCDWLER